LHYLLLGRLLIKTEIKFGFLSHSPWLRSTPGSRNPESSWGLHLSAHPNVIEVFLMGAHCPWSEGFFEAFGLVNTDGELFKIIISRSSLQNLHLILNFNPMLLLFLLAYKIIKVQKLAIVEHTIILNSFCKLSEFLVTL
jgi:hypothetical protein